MSKRQIIVIAHDLRSTHNVGSLLRTAEGLGVFKVYFTGYTPYPRDVNDSRLPHLVGKLHRQIQKTALGAEVSQPWELAEITELLADLHKQGFTLVALEQSSESTPLPSFVVPSKIALLLGSEVEGVAKDLLKEVDVILEIPMFGAKESFNVVQAAAMALYHCSFAQES